MGRRYVLKCLELVGEYPCTHSTAKPLLSPLSARLNIVLGLPIQADGNEQVREVGFELIGKQVASRIEAALKQ